MNLENIIPPGLRVLSLPAQSQVAYCGIAVKAGTRHELPSEQGLAHFCEHLAFKGTRRRTALQIINAIEGVGGELNAFTNKEDTVFYCAVEQKHLRRAVDVLCDIVFCSQYPQQEVEKECEVVCDEIESYEDSPAELIYDEFENILFAGHPLGHNILGTAAQVRSYTSASAARFTARCYRPENSLLFVSGPALTREGRGNNAALFTANPPSSPLPSEGGGFPSEGVAGGGSSLPPIIRHRGTHQAHVMLGGRAYAATDERRWALYLLTNLLGGPAMNSRLNLALRERRGLVYTVDSSMTSYSDAGLWTIYFGCDPDDVDRCLSLVHGELRRLAERPLSAARLSAAKRQLQGQLAIASENREQLVLDSARSALHTGRPRSVADVMARVARLTPADLQACAAELFAPAQTTTLIYK